MLCCQLDSASTPATQPQRRPPRRRHTSLSPEQKAGFIVSFTFPVVPILHALGTFLYSTPRSLVAAETHLRRLSGFLLNPSWCTGGLRPSSLPHTAANCIRPRPFAESTDLAMALQIRSLWPSRAPQARCCTPTTLDKLLLPADKSIDVLPGIFFRWPVPPGRNADVS